MVDVQIEQLNQLLGTADWSATIEQADILLAGPEHPNYAETFAQVKWSIDYINGEH